MQRCNLDEICEQATRLCHVVAAKDPGNLPVYIVPQSRLTADQGGESVCYAYTTPSLDLFVQDAIENWQGRGPCIVVNERALREDKGADIELYFYGLVLHELAHILERPRLYAERVNVSPARIKFESLAVARVLSEPDPEPLENEPWVNHEKLFLRIAFHIYHRARAASFPVTPPQVFDGLRYGLSPAAEYANALESEAYELADFSFREILTQPEPTAFWQLWSIDVIAWHKSQHSGVHA